MKVITVAALLLATTYICPAQTMNSGTGAPSSSVGNNGDLYHRTDVQSVYGPKASGAWPSTFSYIVGQGCTTVYHIDKDCDGYGVGPTTITTDPNRVFGPDADDSDATVNTPASVVTKYGSINAFLTHLGYPTNRVLYIDPVKGVDASGCGTVTSPCQHFSYGAIGTVLNDGAGGTVMYRASTSAGLQICTGGGCYYPHASSLSSPVVIMAYPGEQVTFSAASPPLNLGGGSYNASTNVIISGFSLISSNPGNGYGLVGSWVQNITLENSELAGWSMAVQFAAGSQNTTITQNLFHDVSEHAVYPVTGDQSQGVYSSGLFNCSTWTWQANNTSYNPHINFSTTNNVMLYVGSGGYDAIHYNGQICGGLVSGNVLIDGGGSAITLQDGNQNVTISNNVIANNSASGITVNIYGCDNNGSAYTSGQVGTSCDSSYTGGSVAYYPNMESGNKIINNTVWTGLNAPSSFFCTPACAVGYYGINISDTSEGIPGGRWVRNTTLQNNLLVTFNGNGGGVYPQLWFGRNSYPETNTLANNLLWNAYPGNSSTDVMQIASNSLSCSSAPWYCAGSTTGTYGSGSAYPGTFSFSQFQSYNTGSNTNEVWGNPTFADVQTSYSTTPNMFNFRLLSGSPAIGAGLASGAPSTDITGATRASTPSIGAYEYAAVTAQISLACPPALVTAGVSVTCTVSLPQPAGAGGAVIAVSSNSSAVVAPASVTLAAGASSATFTVTVGAGSPGQTVVLSAAFGGATQTASLVFALGTPTLSSLTCSPTSISSSAAATCNLTLSQPAGSGGITVSILSNITSVTVPTTISVAASSMTAQFSATAGTVSSIQSATISAQYNGSSVSATVSVQPVTGTGTPLVTGTWSMVPFNGWPVSVVGYDGLTYGSGIKKFFMWDNYHNETSESNQAYLAYDFAVNRWDVYGLWGDANGEGMPGSGHPVGCTTYDPTFGVVRQYVGFSGSDEIEGSQQMWAFDPVGLVGRNQQTPTRPGNTQECSAVWDSTDGLYFIINTGQGLWSYNPSTNAFTHRTPGGVTPISSAGYFSGMAWDSANDSIYLFGGNSTNNLYRYSIAGNSWTLLTPSGTPPSARQYTGFAYDSTNNIFLMFGGESSGTYLCDTWVYDPTANSWTQLSPATAPACTAGTTTYSRLSYDADDNVFMLVWTGTGGYAGGSTTGYQQVQNWFFRYGGTGNNVGYAGNPSYSPTSGSINQNSNAWASQPVLAASGSTLSASWIETGTPLVSGNIYFPHIYAAQFSGSTWSNLGSSYLAMDPEASGNSESHDPSAAYVNGVLWNCWNKENNIGTFQPDSLYCKSWNGSSWTGTYIPPRTGGSGDMSTLSSIVGVGTTPYVAFLEYDRSCSPWCNWVYVDSYNGTSWSQVGSGALNRGTKSSSNSPHAESISIATDGTNPYVAWTEFQMNASQEADGTPQLFVSEYTGGSWTALGGSVSNTANWAQSASITYLSQPYVAYTERTQTGVSQVFVKTWTGSSWTTVGSGTLNNNTSTGWAEYPYVFTDGTSLYCAWTEQSALGQKMQVYVDKLVGNSWIALGSSLNADSTNGSAEKPTAAILSGYPVVGWGEVKAGSLRNTYVKQWNGTSWSLSGAATTPPSPCDLNGDGVINIVDVQLAINQATGLTRCTNADLQNNGQCTVVDVQRIINAALGGACVTGQ